MKDAMIKVFDKTNGFFEKILAPFVDKLVDFLQQGEYTIYALIGVFLAIIVLIGLLRWIFKGTKSFFAILIIFGAVFAIWFIFVK